MKSRSGFKKLFASREVSLVIILVVMIVIVSIISPSFFTGDNFAQILKNNTVTMIMAIGMLMVLLIGHIDISVASTLAFSGMTVGIMIKYNVLLSYVNDEGEVIARTFLILLLSTVIGIGCGLLVGIVVAYGRVPSIIASLGFMYIYRGLAYMVANDEWAGATALGTFKDFALNSTLGINNCVLIMIVCYVIFFIILRWTKFGRNIYACGSNPEAAQISGINVKRMQAIVFTINGLLCGLAGGLMVTIYASGQPNMGEGYEMNVIASCVIGGVAMSGGKGNIVGAFLGALILGVINKALPIVGIDSIAQNMIQGVIIIAVVIVNTVSQRGSIKSALRRREI